MGRSGKRSVGRVQPLAGAVSKYVDFLCQSVSVDLLKGVSVVLDCANGAASDVAPAVFDQLGGHLTVLNASRMARTSMQTADRNTRLD